MSVGHGPDQVVGPLRIATLPNPYQPHGAIRFFLDRSATVDVAIFSSAGRRVRDLTRGFWEAGGHTVRWDGLTDGGEKAAPGIYFVRGISSGQTVVSRAALIR